MLDFSKLRLSSFKSFVEPIEIDIKDGLTGVVGPNGCGKSNLVEAIRWVMGEASYKSMRASSMEGVIFQGTQNRPSRNSAEVSLVLNNKDRDAPLMCNDADIIAVTRRIEREAGSVYKLNGNDTRARDIQMLFADASTGAMISFLSSITSETLGRAYRDKTMYKKERLIKSQKICGKKVEKSN